MEKFTASNGRRIESKEGQVRIFDGWGAGTLNMLEDWDCLNEQDMEALSEFIQYKRDQELGRWRWPENPDYVVYPIEVAGHTGSDYRECAVLDESTGVLQEYGSDLPICYGGQSREAARAYFAAHPEPKPWHEAKHGEVWVLTYVPEGGDERTQPFTVDPLNRFRHTNGTVLGPYCEITASRRVWPEGEK